uniref:Uncharacterized protein n=1 Tax=Lepeophtheirus salmonis TaxID=72036 RepID=A0A0K2TVE5_LEPSM
MRSSTHLLFQTCLYRVVQGVCVWRGGRPMFRSQKFGNLSLWKGQDTES